jgi:hypothetical protein
LADRQAAKIKLPKKDKNTANKCTCFTTKIEHSVSHSRDRTVVVRDDEFDDVDDDDVVVDAEPSPLSSS